MEFPNKQNVTTTHLHQIPICKVLLCPLGKHNHSQRSTRFIQKWKYCGFQMSPSKGGIICTATTPCSHHALIVLSHHLIVNQVNHKGPPMSPQKLPKKERCSEQRPPIPKRYFQTNTKHCTCTSTNHEGIPPLCAECITPCIPRSIFMYFFIKGV